MFAGVASVEAVPVYPCPHPKPVSLLEVASQNDPLVAINDRVPQKEVNGFHEPNVEQLVAGWRRAEACKPSGTVAVAGRLSETTWSGCRANVRVAYALYEGGSHMWPRGDADTPSAEQVIWHFFKNRPLPTPAV
jgi:poly(3-hydroxybutyrate) depolymerase